MESKEEVDRRDRNINRYQYKYAYAHDIPILHCTMYNLIREKSAV